MITEITKADGLSIGRGLIGNPFLFSELEYFFKTGEKKESCSIKEKMQTLKNHLDEEIALRGMDVGIKFVRKFYTYYIHGIKNAAGYRHFLVREENYDKIVSVIEEIAQLDE